MNTIESDDVPESLIRFLYGLGPEAKVWSRPDAIAVKNNWSAHHHVLSEMQPGQIDGEPIVTGGKYRVTAKQLGSFAVELCFWNGEPHASTQVGDGHFECIAAADALSNLPELWRGQAMISGRRWLVEGSLREMRLTEAD